MKKTLTLFLALVICICLGACAQLDGRLSADADSPQENTDGSIVYTTGDTITLDDWEITLNGFDVVSEIVSSYGSDLYGYGSYIPDEGNLYLVVNLTAKNIGTQLRTFMPNYGLSNMVKATIIYQDTYNFSPSALLGHSDDLHTSSVNPLSSVTGIIAFQIAQDVADSQDLKLVFSYSSEEISYVLEPSAMPEQSQGGASSHASDNPLAYVTAGDSATVESRILSLINDAIATCAEEDWIKKIYQAETRLAFADIDGDGQDEIIGIYTLDCLSTLWSVWNIENDTATQVAADLLYDNAGGPYGEVGTATYNGQSYFCVYWINYAGEDGYGEYLLYQQIDGAMEQVHVFAFYNAGYHGDDGFILDIENSTYEIDGVETDKTTFDTRIESLQFSAILDTLYTE